MSLVSAARCARLGASPGLRDGFYSSPGTCPGITAFHSFLKGNFVFILQDNRGFCGQWSQIQAADTVHSPGNVLSSSPTALSQPCPVSDQTVLPSRVSWLTPASTPPEKPLIWHCPELLI